jgi:hypothetical protein
MGRSGKLLQLQKDDMSLYEDRIITPAMPYEMKKLKEGKVLE